MAKFKGGYKNEYALMLMAQYFKNTLVYYKGEVDNDDYFDPIVHLYGDAAVEREILSRFDKEPDVSQNWGPSLSSTNWKWSFSSTPKYDFLNGDLDIRSGVRGFLDGQDNEPLQGCFFAIAKPKDVLPWDFYSASLQRHGDMLKRIVTSKKPGRGVNILLYGAPGTGKTSFAFTLAKELGLDAYEIWHGDQEGRNKSLGSRMLGVQACNSQIPAGKGMMIVDEADQVLHTSCGGGLFGFFGFGGGATDSFRIARGRAVPGR